MQEVLEAKEREVQRLTEGQKEVSEKGSPGSPVSEDSRTLIPTSGGLTGCWAPASEVAPLGK